MPTPSTTHRWTRARLCRCSAPPAVMFDRGRGTELWDSDGKRYLDFLAGIAVVSLGHSHPVVAESIADQAEQLLHVSNFFRQPGRDRGGGKDQHVAARRHRPQRSTLLHQLRRRIKRVCHQTRPQARWAWSPHHRQHSRQLPRAHARHPRSHGPAHEARTIPTDARGLPPCSVGRHRCDPCRSRRFGCRSTNRADSR